MKSSKPARRRSRKFLVLGLTLLTLVLIGASQMVGSLPVNPPHHAFLQSAEVPDNVRNIMERACQDCHSNNTQWPWYAHLTPVGNLVKKDVEAGRKFLNFSEWQSYTRGRKMGYLTAMGSSAAGDRMPPKPYRFLHPEARLTPEERKQLVDWSKSERLRVKAIPR